MYVPYNRQARSVRKERCKLRVAACNYSKISGRGVLPLVVRRLDKKAAFHIVPP